MFQRDFFLIFLVLIVCSCMKKSDDSELPELTHEGNNIFACYINGEPFVASVDFTVGGPISVSGSFNEETKRLNIQGTREDENDHLDAVTFKTFVTNSIDSYLVDVTTAQYKGYTDFSQTGGACESYFHDTLNKGIINITYLNESDNVISGTFSMTLINSACSVIALKITDGRFDFGY